MSTPRRCTLAAAAILLIASCGGDDTGADAIDSTVLSDDLPSPTAIASDDAPVSAPAGTTTTTPTTTTPTTTTVTTTVTTTTTTTGATATTAATATTTATTAAGVSATSGPAVPARPATIDELTDSFARLAHAGGDLEAPHSTRFAFDQAVAAGATVLELDVQLTSDGVLVVQHDDTVDKTTEATGPVGALTLAELQALDNAYWFSPDCWPCQDRPPDEYVYRGVRTGAVAPPDGASPDDFRVATFREIAEAFPSLPIDVEIKGSGEAAAATAEALAMEIAELGRTDSVIVVSFDDAVVDTFHALAPDVAVSPGLQRLTAWFLDGVELDPMFRVLQIPPTQGEIQVVSAELVERIHGEGRTVWVWADDASTQDTEAFYTRLIGLDVDGIIAGRPTELTDALAP